MIVTPAHPYPTGIVLGAHRRAALIEWARARRPADHRGRLRRRALLRTRWRSWLSWPLITVKAIEDAGSETASKFALAGFIARGELERHLRRMRLRYQKRLRTLLDAIARQLPNWRALARGDGLHLMVVLPDHVDEPLLLAAAGRRSIGLEVLSLHSYTGGCPPGLVLGHAYMTIERGISCSPKPATRLRHRRLRTAKRRGRSRVAARRQQQPKSLRGECPMRREWPLGLLRRRQPFASHSPLESAVAGELFRWIASAQRNRRCEASARA